MSNDSIKHKTIFRKDGSYFVMATDGQATYKFSSHAIDRLMERNSNMKKIDDLHKFIRRVIRCLSSYKVDGWLMNHPFGTRLIVRDVDTLSIYVVTCNVNYYEVITVYSEHIRTFKANGTPSCNISFKKPIKEREEEEQIYG